MIRLGDGTEESARRMAEGLDWCWRFIPELFEVDELLAELIARGIAADPREFEAEYRAEIGRVLAEAKLEAPADQRPILGGRRGHHSEHLGHLLAVMQFLPRTYPTRPGNGRAFLPAQGRGDRARDRGSLFDPVRSAGRVERLPFASRQGSI